jgi:hypothetical protein
LSSEINREVMKETNKNRKALRALSFLVVDQTLFSQAIYASGPPNRRAIF